MLGLELVFSTGLTLEGAWSCPRRRRAKGDYRLPKLHYIHAEKPKKGKTGVLL